MMPLPRYRTIAAGMFALALAVPVAATAQSEPEQASPSPEAALPVLDGVAWYEAVALAGDEWSAELSADELAQWDTLAETAGVSIDQVEYSYEQAFDPAELPVIGGIASVRIAGTETAAVRDAVIADLTAQVTGLGEPEPDVSEAVMAEKDVLVVPMPEALSEHDAVVYASGDQAWVILLEPDLVEQTLNQLP